MCQPIFTLAFCAVFAPAPTHADTPWPIAVVVSDEAAKKPPLVAGTIANAPTATTSNEVADAAPPEGRRGDGPNVLPAPAATSSHTAPRESAPDDTANDTERKGASTESAADTDVEAK